MALNAIKPYQLGFIYGVGGTGHWQGQYYTVYTLQYIWATNQQIARFAPDLKPDERFTHLVQIVSKLWYSSLLGKTKKLEKSECLSGCSVAPSPLVL